MGRFLGLTAFATAVILLSCGGNPDESVRSKGSDKAPVQDTTALYAQRCATCHGMNGAMQMGGAKRLTESVATREEIIGQIRYGKGTMPPFGQILSDTQIEALADYTLGFRKTDASRD